MTKKTVAIALFACAAFTASSSSGQLPGLNIGSSFDLSVSARAEAGLDQATRDFIRTLPGEWRPQLADIVDDAADRVDESVKVYIASLDELLSKKVSEVQCAAVGGSQTILDAIAKMLPLSSQSGPMVNLLARMASEAKLRKYGSSPTYIKALYNDQMFMAGVVSCQNHLIPTAQADAGKIIAGLSAKWLVWNRVESTGCSLVSDCLDSYRQVVEQVIAQSDSRDLDESGAAVALAAYTDPQRPTTWTAVDFDVFETSMTELYKIENMVGAARAIREVAAIRELERAVAEAEAAEKLIRRAFVRTKRSAPWSTFRSLRGSNCRRFHRAARGALRRPIQDLGEAQQALTAAEELAAVIKPYIDAQATVINDQMARATVPATFCKG